LLLFAIDVERPGDQSDFRHLAQRNLSDAAAVRPLRPDGDAVDRFGVLAEPWRQANHDRKVPITARLVNVASRLAADRGPYRRVDVAGREAVARRAGTVDLDLDRRLAERGEDGDIGDAWYRRQHGFAPAGCLGQCLRVVAEALDRVLAFDAGDLLGHIVLQILREVELDAGKFLPQLSLYFAG